jgi:PAS domain S-box-containing protein
MLVHSESRSLPAEVVLAGHTQDALLASIVDSSGGAIMAKLPDATITFWNRGVQAIYGYTTEEIVGKPVWLLIHPGRQDEMAVIFARIRNGERVEHYETMRVRKDGQAISISLTVSPILDALGRLIGVSSIARDIAARRRIEDPAREASAYART